LAERVLGKDEVTSSILVIGSILRFAAGMRVASDGRQANPGNTALVLCSREAAQAETVG
jgi:hypothetical protein